MTIKGKYVDILVDVTCALRGRATPNLRALYVIIKGPQAFEYTFYYDDPPSEDEEELASLADTSVLCDFSSTHQTDFRVTSIQYPQQIRDPGFCVYHRYEKPFDGSGLYTENAGSLLERIRRLPNGELARSEAMDPATAQEDTRLKILLFAQCALRWHVTPNLRAAYVAIKNHNAFECTMYYDAPLSELERTLVASIEQAISSECAPAHATALSAVSMRHPQKIHDPGFCIYDRYEQ